MKRRIPLILAAVLVASGCSGTRKAAPSPVPETPPGDSAGTPQSPPEGQGAAAEDDTAAPKSVPLHDYLINQGRYTQAVAAFTQEALQAETAPDPETKFRYERLGQLLARVGFTAVPAREDVLRRDTAAAELARKSITAFIAERDRQALLFAAAAQGADPEEAAFRLLLQAIEAWTGRPAEAGERQPPDRVAAYKLRRANALFEEKRYEDAAAQCLEALLLVPNDAAIYERLGSMYYALGARARAIDAWRESLRLDPTNAPLKDFMSRFESDAPKAGTP